MNNQRDIFIDVLKALAIFLVVLGHAPLCHGFIKQFVYSFHMPLFFAIYGMTYSIDKHRERRFLNMNFLKNKVKRLLIPALIWAIGYTLVNDGIQGNFNIKHLILDCYGSQQAYSTANSLTSIWFLPVMFLSVCLTELMMSLYANIEDERKRNTVIIMSIALLPVITIALPKIGIGYPGGANLVPIATSFILLGYLINESSLCEKIKKMRIVTTLAITVILAALTAVLTYFNLPNITIHNVDMAGAHFGNPLLYMVTAMLGIVMMLTMTKIIVKMSKAAWWTFIGSNTLGIFLVHKPLVIILCQLSSEIGLGAWPMSFVCSLVVVALSIPVLYMINKYIPQIIGNIKN